MFKGLSVFFETYSITASDSKNIALQPIDVSCSLEFSVARVRELLEKLGYGSFVEDKNFKELFAKSEKFETTVSFIVLPSGGTRIGAAVFSPKGKRTKKVLIALMQELSQAFNNEKI